MALCLTVCAPLALLGCQLRRPEVALVRTIEPELAAAASDPAATPPPGAQVRNLRLLETEARVHIGRRLIHQQPDGELIEDAVWRWSSPPDRYLDTVLRLTLGSSRDIRLVDAADAPVLGVMLLAFHLGESDARLFAAIEVRLTGTDRVVQTRLIRDSEPISGALPGDLSAGSGRLLIRLAAAASRQAIAMH